MQSCFGGRHQPPLRRVSLLWLRIIWRTVLPSGRIAPAVDCSLPSGRTSLRALNQVAKATGRGAPAVSRSIDVLVRAGLIERAPDPDNRRRLAMRLTEQGRDVLQQPSESGALASMLERLAPSEVRAIERAVEILERSA